MKRLLSIIIICSLLNNSWSQESTPKTTNDEYLRKHLSIDVRGIGVGGGNVGYGGSVSINMNTWTQWIPYQGFTKIKESDFFSIAGFPEEATISKNFEKRNFIMWISGLTISVIAIIGIIPKPTGPEDYNTPIDDFYLYLNLGALVAGSTVAITGGYNMRMNKYPLSVAQLAMDSYNKKLLDELQ